MSGRFQKSSSGMLVTVLIGLIVVSFMFGGYTTYKGTPDTIAKVDGNPIKIGEFRKELDRQIQGYQQMFGKDLTSKEIESLNIKKRALESIINSKLLVSLAKEVGINSGSDEIKNRIKELPYFKTNEKFDIQKYKFLLSRNSLTPQDFENDIKKEVITRKLQNHINSFPISKTYVKELEQIKDNSLSTHIVQIEKRTLPKFIKVKKSELKKFLTDEKNLARVQSSFNDKKKTLDTPEQIKASHILIKTGSKKESDVLKQINDVHKKVNVKNFKKMANKFSDDQAEKKNGGDLGWFEKGRMVPEFEKVAFELKPGSISKPVKSSFGYHIIYVENKKASKEAIFDDHKNSIAKEMIQTTKNEDVKKLATTLIENIKKSLENAKLNRIEKLQNKYEFAFEKNSSINRLDGLKGQITLEEEIILAMFNSNNKTRKTLVFDKPSRITFVSFIPEKKSNKLDDKSISDDYEQKMIKQSLSTLLFKNILSTMRSNVSIIEYGVL